MRKLSGIGRKAQRAINGGFRHIYQRANYLGAVCQEIIFEYRLSTRLFSPERLILVVIHLFLKNVSFIKTTGVHTPQGLILYENFKILKKTKLIENHKIFNYICKYFQI
mgnify:CR=1 FL=1